MKYLLILAYLQSLIAYLYCKVDGKDQPGVINNLIHIKTLIDKLKSLDQKLAYQIEKSLKTAALGSISINDTLKYKVNVEDLEEDVADKEQESEKEETTVYRPAKLNPVFIDSKKSRRDEKEEMMAKQKFGRHDYVRELKREALDRPEELNLTGSRQHSKFANKMNRLEEMELDAFKRVSLTKKERNKLRHEAREDE